MAEKSVYYDGVDATNGGQFVSTLQAITSNISLMTLILDSYALSFFLYKLHQFHRASEVVAARVIARVLRLKYIVSGLWLQRS